MKMTPFKALYDHDPLILLKGTTLPSTIEEVNKLAVDRDNILAKLKNNLLKAQDRMKPQVNHYH